MTFVMSGNSRAGSRQPGVAGQWGSKTSFWGQPERREGVGGGGATTARPVLGWCGGGGVGEGRRCGPGLIGTLQLRSSAALPSDPALELPSAPVSRVPCPVSRVPCLVSHVLCPVSHVPCPMFHVLCPMSHVPCPVSHVPCPPSHVPCPHPVSPIPCPMSHVRCPVSRVPNPMSPIPCPVSCVPCPPFRVPCPPSHVPCPVSRVPHPVSQPISPCPFQLRPEQCEEGLPGAGWEVTPPHLRGL